MTTDGIQVSTTLLVWLLSLAVGGMTALFSVCAHVLINIKNNITRISLSITKIETSTELRLATLEKEIASLAHRMNTQRQPIINNNVNPNN